jgi:hypothetical protein
VAVQLSKTQKQGATCLQVEDQQLGAQDSKAVALSLNRREVDRRPDLGVQLVVLCH